VWKWGAKGADRGLFPWKISPQTRAQQEKRAPGGCGGVAQLPNHHQTNPAFLTGGFVVVVVIAATTKSRKLSGKILREYSPTKL